jgi:hypothetical protein
LIALHRLRCSILFLFYIHCNQVQSVTSSDSPTPPLSGFTTLMTSAAPIISTPGDVEHTGADVEANSPDGERIRVLNQLLQQLESRRADRQK